MPAISVIIPAFNAEETILETIQSIQQQTFQDFELIVINDGSNDRTLEIVNQINEPRLKVFSYENAGVSVARNRGIDHAQGDFISFIDADDAWTSDKLESQLSALQSNPNAGAAYSWSLNMSSNNNSLSFSQGCSSTLEGNIYPQLLLGSFIGSGSNILVRRDAVESTQLFKPTLNAYADWDFYLQLAINWDFIVICKNQILYRKTSNSMSSKVKVMEEEGIYALESIYQAAPPELQYLKKQSLAFLHRYWADLCLANSFDVDSIKLAKGYLWSSMSSYPEILLEKYTQNLIVKLVLKWLLPTKVSSSAIQTLKKLRSIRDPRLHP